MKRKMICVLCAVLLVSGLAGCSAVDEINDNSQENSDTSVESTDALDDSDTGEAEEHTEEFPATEAVCTEPGPDGFVATGKYAAYYTPAGFGSTGEGIIQINDSRDVYAKLFEMEGTVSGLMGTADKIYFVLNDSMYSYSGGTAEEMVISDVKGFVGFVGMIDGVIYYKIATDDPSVAEVKIVSYDTQAKKQREFALESGWGNVETLITGNHLFYRGGSTDPSATSLYELNLESGKSVQLENYISSMASDQEGKLYFTSFDSYDSLEGDMTLKCYDITTEEKTDVFQPASNPGTIVTADPWGVYFELNIDGHSLSRLDLESGELETLAPGRDVYYLPDCTGNTFYCVEYDTDSDMVITGSRVYEYSKDPVVESGINHLELRADVDFGQVLGLGYGIVFCHEKDDSGESYGVGPATVYDNQLFY